MLGITPYSIVGYETETKINEPAIGEIHYKFSGSGGLNKAYLGYGVMPFNKRLTKFRTKRLFIPDSLKRLSRFQFNSRHFASKVLSDFSLGFNVNYIFGNIVNDTRVMYPNSIIYNNSFRERVLNMGDFTGNFGAQTAMTKDSVRDYKSRKAQINAAVAALRSQNIYPDSVIKIKQDSIAKATPLQRRVLREKIKFSAGYFMTLNNPLKVNYSTGVYNYILNGAGQEIIRDTAIYKPDQKGTITLPMEQGFGIGFKKGERINIVADFAITNWQNFKYLDGVSEFRNNYRVSAGVNFVPEKYAAGRGAFMRKVNYRFGASYQTGYISVNNTTLSNFYVSAGVGLPVGIGRLSSMVNISAQYGQMGTTANSLIKENYWRIHFGFTFSDRWFQKFRYD